MKRMIKASSSRLEKIRSTVYAPSKARYTLSGNLDEEGGVFWGQIVKVSPYDDADYWWARINGGGLIEFIQGGKVKKTFEFKEFDEDMYESTGEYMDEMADTAVRKLDELNKQVSPHMMYN